MNTIVKFYEAIDDSLLKFAVVVVQQELWRIGVPARIINVGCMMEYMDYTPRTLDEILAANTNEYEAKTNQEVLS